MLVRDYCVLRVVAGNMSMSDVTEAFPSDRASIKFLAIDQFGQARLENRNPAKVGRNWAVRVQLLARAPMR
jgi:hypothetical protein